MTLAIMAFNISDIAVLALLLIAFVVGIIRGFANSFRGCFFNIVILIVTLGIAGVCVNPILSTKGGTALYSKIYEWSNSWGDMFTLNIFFNDDGAIMYEKAGELVPMENVVTNAILLKIFSIVLPKLLPPDGGYSLRDSIVPNFVAIIFLIILTIVFFIVLRLIAYFIGKVVDDQLYKKPEKKKIDRICGGFLSAILCLVILLFCYAIIFALGKLPGVSIAAEYIQSSAFAPLFGQQNPLLALFKKIFIAIGA